MSKGDCEKCGGETVITASGSLCLSCQATGRESKIKVNKSDGHWHDKEGNVIYPDERKDDIQSVINMLEGETDREDIVNYIKKYLK